jgi:hypothetical protein
MLKKSTIINGFCTFGDVVAHVGPIAIVELDDEEGTLVPHGVCKIEFF